MRETVLSQVEIRLGLGALGVTRGQTVMLHVAYSKLEPVEGGPTGLLDAILDVLGHEGTLLVPTFSLGYCNAPVAFRWWHAYDPSPLGIVTETARTDARFSRICHPIYSFAVAGRLAPVMSHICSVSAAGADSVFALLAPLHAHAILLGVPFSTVTYIHHVEEMAAAPYRYRKEFEGWMVDDHGVGSEVFPTLYVRDWDKGVIGILDTWGAELDRRGYLAHRRIGPCQACLVDLAGVETATRNLIEDGAAEGLLYRIGTPEEARSA